MKLTTAKQMRSADARAIATGIPSIRLMETASRAVADAAMPYLSSGGTALVLCGSSSTAAPGYCFRPRPAGWQSRARDAGFFRDGAAAERPWRRGGGV